jgi:hypothetical protein
MLNRGYCLIVAKNPTLGLAVQYRLHCALILQAVRTQLLHHNVQSENEIDTTFKGTQLEGESFISHINEKESVFFLILRTDFE